MKTMAKPDLGFWKLWNLSFGFFGVQIAYALQSANISRIFQTLGADPHNLSYFWILPPLAGLIIQPAHHRHYERPHMEPLRPPPPLSAVRLHSGCNRDVPTSKCRKFPLRGSRSAHIRCILPDDARRINQHINATV